MRGALRCFDRNGEGKAAKSAAELEALGLPGAEHRPALAALLAESDVVSVHCPLNAATTRLCDAAFFAAMKPGATFVNTSRGPVVDQDALVAALDDPESGPASAGLDVTDPEPLSPAHALVGRPDCVVLPHIGSATTETRRRMCDLALENLLSGLSGKPLPHPVA